MTGHYRASTLGSLTQGTERSTPIMNPRTDAVSRRSALAGLGAGGLGLALAATVRQASAHDAKPNALAGHPAVGAWLVLNAPTGPTTIIFSADGTAVFGTQATQATPQGGVFVSASLGTWESTGEHSIRFTAVNWLSDANGASAGSITVDAYQTVSADGQSFASDPATVVTIRDASYNVVMVIGPNGPGRPVTGVRMSVGSPGFPTGTSTNHASPDDGGAPSLTAGQQQ